MTISARRANYRLGSLYSLVTAVLLATQEPFSALAARRSSSAQFICLMQFALLLSVPLPTLPAASRRDFIALLSDARNFGKLAIVFSVGLCCLLLYNIGLSSAHPLATATLLNLLPLWAALVAMIISGKSIPVSPVVFFGCFAVAFVGALIVAWSQVEASNEVLFRDVVDSIFHSRWGYAIPIPIFFALSGTLVYRWFSEFDEAAAIAANFVVSSFILIPATLLILYMRSNLGPAISMDEQKLSAVLWLLPSLTLGSNLNGSCGREVGRFEPPHFERLNWGGMAPHPA